MMIEILSWLMFVLVITSTILTIKLKRIGWIVGLMASIIGLIYSALTSQIAMCCLNAMYIGLNIYGFRQWKNKL